MLAKYTTLWSLMCNERRSLMALRTLQEAKLRRLVRHAYSRVPFYRRLFTDKGLVPDDIRTLEDLQKLPVIDKAELKAQPIRELISDRFDSTDGLIRLSTAGSSGAPFDFFIDKRYDQLRKAQSLRPYVSNGRRIFDCVVHFTAHPHSRPKWFHRLGLLREERIDCNAPHALQLQALTAARPSVIQGYPSVLLSLAAVIRDEGIEIPKPKLVFTDSELLTPQTRKLIGQVFQAPVVDVFGTWEADNIAYECGRRCGHHIAMDCVVLELITREGNPAQAGEEGEMVCTVLDNLAMPFIRYNLHDLAEHATGPCACGRSFPLLKVIAGRSDDMVRLANGRIQSPLGFIVAFHFLSAVVKEYQIVQSALEEFCIFVVPTTRFDAAAKEKIRSILSSRYPSAHVSIILVDRIQREPSGKLRQFRSQVPR